MKPPDNNSMQLHYYNVHLLIAISFYKTIKAHLVFFQYHYKAT